MKAIYQSPFRLFILLGLLLVLSLFAGLRLPISLFPNSAKPTISVGVHYGSMNSEEFYSLYGSRLESALNGISTPNLEISRLTADYGKTRVHYALEFGWGADPKEAFKEVQSVSTGVGSRFPREVRDSISINFWSRSSGFIAISFFSPSRSLEEVYRLLDATITPRLSAVQEADNPSLWNPGRREVIISLKPEEMARLGLFPRDIELALDRGLEGYVGGAIAIGTQNLQVQMPRSIESLQTIRSLFVEHASGVVHLSDVANVEIAEASESNQVFKTNSSKSIILFANPRSGANVKEMAEKIIMIVEESMTSLPSDIEYRLIVDPSEFIRSSIKKVFLEVCLAAGIAALVLFIFIGSFRNTLTAAFEIPLSMILAFILMWVFDMNLNLISLGGLALAAGMNVDAAVVVMENIFRHLQLNPGLKTAQERVSVIVKAVNEVKLSIIASTISTLVVFGPLMFTKDLTNAILGDLAKAVVFSHVFSLLIALFVVPTIRLIIINRDGEKFQPPQSPIQKFLVRLEDLYCKTLRTVIYRKKIRNVLLVLAPLLCIVTIALVAPKLEREIIGKPDTDWLIVSLNTQGNNLIGQMETMAGDVEARVLDSFGDEILYTFNQIQRPNNATLMLRLKDKSKMKVLLARLEEFLPNTPEVFYWVGPWNPAELPIPEFADMKLVVRGGTIDDRASLAEDILLQLREKDFYSRISSTPGLNRQQELVIVPHQERWIDLRAQGVRFYPSDLLDLARVATEGKTYRAIPLEGQELITRMNFPTGEINSVEKLSALPLRVGSAIIPLKAISDIRLRRERPILYKENKAEVVFIEGSHNKNEKLDKKKRLQETQSFIEEYLAGNPFEFLGLSSRPVVFFEDAQKDLTAALRQALVALIASLILIFVTLIFQFTSFSLTLIIMSAIPFAAFGGILSLFVFGSTLSLNSALGIILLNGIAVNNSIILVDFMRNAIREGDNHLFEEGIIEACRSRLRPILITSMTTILGMLPIALGRGDGGKILQPLGIAVSGGLWFSMLFTLIIVPVLASIVFRNGKYQADSSSNVEKSSKRTETIVEVSDEVGGVIQ
jgi:hydrophobic/amphiphilic exporter-1 (mainly G- bacteria), HAE1 family